MLCPPPCNVARLVKPFNVKVEPFCKQLSVRITANTAHAFLVCVGKHVHYTVMVELSVTETARKDILEGTNESEQLY